MCVTLGLGMRGVSYIKKGDIGNHQRMMVWACNVILFFVVSYVVKVVVLGREPKAGWQMIELVILYTHEFFILVMLVGGARARYFAARFKDTLATAGVGEGDRDLRTRHARAGKMALVGSACALLSAIFVLIILYRHMA
jgi:uncharacterized membrane protein YozB (DUF420 family)